MTGKERVLSAIKCHEVDRAPWVPFVGCHAAGLIGENAEAFFKSEELIVKGVLEAARLYRPDGIPALFDLQLEAEAMGCGVRYAPDNPPSVTSHPLAQGKSLDDLQIPDGTQGRFPLVLRATRRICEALGKDTAVYGLITGPFTLALHLKGTDIFYDMIDDPEGIDRLMAFCSRVCVRTAGMYIDAGVDVVAVVDPMVSQISPISFEQVVAPHLAPIYEAVRAAGKLVSLFVCGDATRNIEKMCQTRPDNISIDENIPLDFVIKTAHANGVSVGGNIKLTLTMLFGTPTDNMRDAENCMAIGGKVGYILSPGCDMPFATPKENAQAIASLVHGEVKEFLESSNVLEGVECTLPDYENEPDVIVDVITLDSESCAPCQYMMAAVRAAAQGMDDKLQYIEHKVKEKKAVACMLALGVANIPTIVVDGQIRYVSITPDVEELRSVFSEAIERKARLRHA